MIDPKEFWNKAHESQDLALLTGSPPEDVLKLHGIFPWPRGQRIADIGYGTGSMQRFLSKHNDVVSFDVADVAGTRNISELKDSGEFDIGICHLVAQHNPPETIPKLIPNLTLGGFFSIHFSSLDKGECGFQGRMDWIHTPEQMERYVRPLTVTQRRQADMGDRISWWIFRCENW